MSIKKSAPTFTAFAFDVPEPQNFDGKFQYNYFVKDERLTSDSFSDIGAVQIHTPRSDFDMYQKKPGVPAREIILEFTALENITNLSHNKLTTRSKEERRRILLNESSKILSEVNAQTERTSFVAVQDDEIAQELQAIVDSTLLHQKAADRGLSPLEAALKFNSIASSEIKASDILEATYGEASSNLTYYDPATGEDMSVQKQGGVSEYAIGGFYNKKFIKDILSTSENTPFSPLWGTVDNLLPDSSRVQTEAMATLDSNTAYISDFEYIIEPVDDPLSITQGVFPPTVEVCGYLIERHVQESDGTYTFEKIIPITSVTKSTYHDHQVTYGKIYKYTIKSVFFLNTTDPSGTYNTVNLVTYLISSRGSPFIEVSCNEVTPPPPPENIQFFLSSGQELLIFWDMPHNLTGDIKRFQVFRRTALSDPYTLISEIDFDDSEELTYRTETVPSFTNEKKDWPTVHYTDTEFEFDKTYYYAICSVDAHDLSSPYSTQFKVSYNRIEGKMETTIIGWAGAPKPYPNFTLKETLIVDCIKDSGHSKLKVYFDPECLILNGPIIKSGGGKERVTSARVRENFIETNSRIKKATAQPMYKMQIINLDRQLDQKLDIYLTRSSDLIKEIDDKLPGD